MSGEAPLNVKNLVPYETRKLAKSEIRYKNCEIHSNKFVGSKNLYFIANNSL